MRLGYKAGFRIPRCPQCAGYMHEVVESRDDYTWVFPHCGYYWVVTYTKGKEVAEVADTVTGKKCHRCDGSGFYYTLISGEYELVRCKIYPLMEVTYESSASIPKE